MSNYGQQMINQSNAEVVALPPFLQPVEKKFLWLSIGITGIALLVGIAFGAIALIGGTNSASSRVVATVANSTSFYATSFNQSGSFNSSTYAGTSTASLGGSSSDGGNQVGSADTSSVNLPVAVYPGARLITLKPEQQRDTALALGFGKLMGLRNTEYYVFASSDSKDKVAAFYQREFASKGYQTAAAGTSTNIQGLGATKISLAGVNIVSIGFVEGQNNMKYIEGNTNGLTIYAVVWAEGRYEDLM
ncbi:MAG: hypothetical protein HXX08_15570 [Chloroflexi bacterium]|uniref:Uncharacterized protein n=1 Tax=Candidatus Chlorohelix allophototropha TaxID=3003348 RepID=A0A8T7M596_9CHLR|nr:hypothetical protein [Chloroflexota bacterium]WJW69199.1 hypothetical protein OZ401_002795 [Chloroflexota bacterium L227-S17]